MFWTKILPLPHKWLLSALSGLLDNQSVFFTGFEDDVQVVAVISPICNFSSFPLFVYFSTNAVCVSNCVNPTKSAFSDICHVTLGTQIIHYCQIAWSFFILTICISFKTRLELQNWVVWKAMPGFYFLSLSHQNFHLKPHTSHPTIIILKPWK